MNSEHPTVRHNICDPFYKSADDKLVVKLHDNIFETISEKKKTN